MQPLLFAKAFAKAIAEILAYKKAGGFLRLSGSQMVDIIHTIHNGSLGTESYVENSFLKQQN